MSGTPHDAAIAIYDGRSCEVTTPLACDVEDFLFGEGPALVEVDLVAGQHIKIDVDGDTAGQGDAYTLDIYRAEYGRCADSNDTDMDGFEDCNDSECDTDSFCSSCITGVVSGTGRVLASQGFDGSDQTYNSCGSDGLDVAFRWTAPTSGSYRFELQNVVGTGLSLALLGGGDCSSSEVTCQDTFFSLPSFVTTVSAGQSYVLAIDDGAAADIFDLVITAQ